MLKPLLAIAILFFLTQALGMLSDKMRSDLYAQYRNLKRMPSNSEPVKALYFWGNVGGLAQRARLPLLLATLGCVAAHVAHIL